MKEGKIKVFNIVLDARLGGPQRRIAEVGRVLVKEFNVETTVIFPKDNYTGFGKLLDSYGIGYKTMRLHKLSKNPLNLLKWKFFFIPEIYNLLKYIKMENPDIIHCNGSWQWKGVIAGNMAKKKVIWHLNDTKIPFLVKMIFKILSKYVDGLIVAGSKVKEYYENNFIVDKPSFVIQAPVNLKTFNPLTVKNCNNHATGEILKIVSVGNVNPYKGFGYLVEAAYILKKRNKNIGFYIAGSLFSSQNKYIKMLKKRIFKLKLDNFIFLGEVDDIPCLLKSADIYVCSSVAEASPQSVWEAMAMEKPIVSTDVGAVPDFIKDGENGFIAPVKDFEILAEKIGKLIDDESLRKTFGKRAREIAVKELDLKICAKKHFDAYNTKER